MAPEYHPKKRDSWSIVQSAIGKKSDKPDMYTTVMEAAGRRSDTDMLTRLQGVPNGDLVAMEARYHRSKSCYQRPFITSLPQLCSLLLLMHSRPLLGSCLRVTNPGLMPSSVKLSNAVCLIHPLKLMS